MLRSMQGWLARQHQPCPVEMPEPDPASAPPRIVSGASFVRPDWLPERMAVADTLWGEGFILPGGEDEVLRLAKPLGLSAACSVLLLGCGGGGPARCLAERLGAWVSGFERDPALVAAATRRCTATGLGRRAQIGAWDPAAPRFPARAYHHGLALEPLGQGGAATVFAAIAAALRPGSNFVLVEVVTGDEAGGDPAPLADWLRVERRERPPTAATITRALEELNFDVRVIEDLTQRHVGLTVRGWHELVRAMSAERPTPARAAPLVREAERWLRRVRLMRAGHLQLMRWHALGREVA